MDKALGYLGLAARAGRLAVGAEDCADRLRRGVPGLLVSASDAGRSTLDEARYLAQARGRTVFPSRYTKRVLADALGRSGPVALVMICDEGLGAAFLKAAGGGHGNEEERV